MSAIIETKHGHSLPLYNSTTGSVIVLRKSKTINVCLYPVDVYLQPEHCRLYEVQTEGQKYFLLTAYDYECKTRVTVSITNESGQWLAENFKSIQIYEVES